jgi:hypothetical protein
MPLAHGYRPTAPRQTRSACWVDGTDALSISSCSRDLGRQRLAGAIADIRQLSRAGVV